MTRPRFWTWRSDGPIASTTWGWTRIPPLTIAEYAVASWSEVTATPWPNAPFARSIWRQARMAGSRTMPPTSPARSTPVGLPKPIRIHVEWRIPEAVRMFGSRPMATFAATTLRDQAIASSNLIQPFAL